MCNYLGIVILVIIVVISFAVLCYINSVLKGKCEKHELEVRRLSLNNTILKDWLLLRQHNISLEDWLIRNQISTVAVYGYGILGRALCNELENSSITIKCIVDRKYQSIYANVQAVGLDNIPEVDAIIVSVVNYYDEIESELLRVCKCSIISLEDIVYGVGYKFEE